MDDKTPRSGSGGVSGLESIPIVSSRLVLAVALALICAAPVSATNGLQVPGYGVETVGMGGAGVAHPQDAQAAANNPAGMGAVGQRVDFSLSALWGHIDSRIGEQSISDEPLVPIPGGGVATALGETATIGISVYGNGFELDYGEPVAGAESNTSSHISQIIAAPTFAWQATPAHKIGISLLAGFQTLEITGVEQQGLNNPGSDDSHGVGLGVGWLHELRSNVRIGVAYKSKIDMTRLDRYEDLVADRGDIDIPQQFSAGVALDVSSSTTLAFDYLWIDWAQVTPLGNEFPGNSLPGTADGPGFGWNSQHIFRLGAEQALAEGLALQVGISHGTQLYDGENTRLNYITPATPQTNLTLGLSYEMPKGVSLAMSYARALEREVEGTGASEGVDTRSAIDFLTIGAGYRF